MSVQHFIGWLLTEHAAATIVMLFAFIVGCYLIYEELSQ